MSDQLEFVPSAPAADSGDTAKLSEQGINNQPPPPRAVSVADPIPDPSPDMEFVPADGDNTPAFVPPIVAASPFKDGIMKQLNREPSDQSFDEGVNLNMGDLKWPLMAFKGVNPDVAAKVDQLAKSNGIPYSAANAGKEDLEVLAQAKQIYASLSATDSAGNFVYPNTIRWLQDPANLAKTKDDVNALANIEGSVKAQQQAGESSFYQTLRSTDAGFAKTVADILRTPSAAYSAGKHVLGGMADDPGPIGQTLNTVTGDAFKNLPQTDNPDWLDSFFGLARHFDNVAKSESGATLDNRSFAGDLAKGDFKGAAQSGTVALANFLPMIAASAVDPALGLATGTSQSVGGQYQADIASGKSPDQIGEDALLNAGVNIAALHTTGTVGQMERMKALFAKPIGNETATQLWGRIAKQSLTSAVQGGLTQGAMQGGTDAADYETGNKDAFQNETSKIVSSAILGFVADGAIAGPAGALEGLRQIKAQQDGQDAWNRLTGAVSGSKLTSRDPDAQADFINQNLLAAGQPTTVGIDADKLTTFFQGKGADFNKFASDMGLKPEDISNAAATGGAVDLPIGQYMAKYSGKSDVDAAINQDLRFTPGGLSANELKDKITQVQQIQATIKAELDKMGTPDEAPLPNQVRQIRETLMTPKDEGGMGYNADQADGHIAVLMAGIKHSVALPGESVSDAVTRLGLGVQVGGENPDGARGAISFGNGKTTIHLFKTADLSTFLHEGAHLFLDQRQKMIDAGVASPQAVADHQTLLDWAGVKPGEKPTDDHIEKIVKGFESYTREGKAPSLELSGPFGKFRSWLTSIYRSVTALGTKPTDEVSQVFDRMLAGEDDIQHAQEYYSRTGEILGLIKADEKAKADAKNKLATVKKTELDKQVSAYLKSYLKAVGGMSAIREAATEAVEAQPIYQALDTAKDGKIDEDSLRAALGTKGLAEFEAKFPRLVKKGGDHTLETLAAQHGFESPETLADNLLAAVPKAEAVKNYASRLFAEKESQLRDEIVKRGATPADKVMHTEGSLAYLIAETQLMAAQVSKGKPNRVSAAAYRDAARQAISDMPVKRAVRYSDFAKNEARLAKQVLDLARRGKWDEALEARKKQLAQHAMVQESIKARDDVQDIVNRYKPSKLESRLKNVDNDFVDPVRQILSDYGLSDTPPKQAYDLNQLGPLDSVMFSQIASWIVNGENRPAKNQSYRDLGYGQLQDVDNAARTVMEFGSDQRKSDLAIAQTTITAAANRVVENVQTLRDRSPRQLGGKGVGGFVGDQWTKALQTVDWIGSHLSKFQFTARILDAFKVDVATKIFRGMREGEKAQGDAQSGFYERAKPHLQTLVGATERLRKEFGTRFAIEGVEKPDAYAEEGRTGWSPEELVTYMMNTGAEGNISALKNSFQHDTPQFDRVARFFSTKELHAMDGVREALDSLFDGLDKTNFKLYNRHVDKVDAVPQDLTDNEGNPVRLKGGYWPLMFDRRVNESRGLGDGSDADLLTDQTRAMIRSAKPQDGFTKGRVVGHSLSPRLDMGVLGDHVDNVTRFTHLGPLIRDAQRILTSPQVRSAVVDKLGPNEYKQMVDWLRHQANPGRKQTDDLNRGIDKYIADKARTLGTKNGMGLNALSFFKWRTALFNGAAELGGWKWVARGYGDGGLQGLGTSTLGLTNNDLWKQMVAKSNVLGPREEHGVRDLRNDVEKLTWNPSHWLESVFGKRISTEAFNNALYSMAKLGDRAVVFPVWRGAYVKYMETMAEDGATDEERDKAAVAYADDVIQASQPTSMNIDLASIHRNQGSWVKLLSMFSTYPVTLSNRFRGHYEAYRNGAITFPQFINKMTQEGVMEPMARTMISAAWHGAIPTAAASAVAPMTNALQTIPVVSSIASSIWNMDPSELSPALDFYKKGDQLFKDLKTSKGTAVVAWDLARLAGYVTGVPVLNLVKPVLDWLAKSDGEKSPYK
jgi:hypothetical protein